LPYRNLPIRSFKGSPLLLYKTADDHRTRIDSGRKRRPGELGNCPSIRIDLVNRNRIRVGRVYVLPLEIHCKVAAHGEHGRSKKGQKTCSLINAVTGDTLVSLGIGVPAVRFDSDAENPLIQVS